MNLSPLTKDFVAIEAVDTKVPPPVIVGRVPASKIEVPFLLISTIALAPDATVRVMYETHCNVPDSGMIKAVWMDVVGPERPPTNEKTAVCPIPSPVIEAPEAFNLVETNKAEIEAREVTANWWVCV